MTATPRCCSAPRSYLAETRNFAGTAVVIFQPAEEGGAGGKAMLDDGLVDRFGIDEFYGMHNYPGMPVGEFAHARRARSWRRPTISTSTIEGVGGHAARPHTRSTRSWSARRSSTQLQSIVSRNVDPLQSAVVSVCHVPGRAHRTTSSRRRRPCTAPRAA